MSLNSLPNALRPSNSLENLSLYQDKASQSEGSGRESLSPLHNRTVAVDPKPVCVIKSMWDGISQWFSPPQKSDRQEEGTVAKPKFTLDRSQGIEIKGSTPSPLAVEWDPLTAPCYHRDTSEKVEITVDNPQFTSDRSPKRVDQAIEQRLKDNHGDEQSTVSGLSRNESINKHSASNESVVTTDTPKVIPTLSSKSPAVKKFSNGDSELQSTKETVRSLLDDDDALSQVLPALFKEKKEAVHSPLEDDDAFPQAMQALFGEDVQSPLKGTAEIESWFEQHSDPLDSLDSTHTKQLAQFEKKFPEALQNKLVNQSVEAYSSKNSTAADTQLKGIRQHLSPQLMAAVDQSVIETLETGGKTAAAQAYHTNQVAMLPIHYNDVLKLDQLAQDLQAGRSLNRAEQEKLLAETKASLETIDTKSFTAEQQELLQAAKERVADLERALPLVDKSKVNKSDVLKTIAGSAGLAACLTAIGALISILVKLGQSGSVDEQDSDQTEAIEEKQNEIEAKENSLQELKSKEKELLGKGANLADDEIKTNAERAGFEEVINKNELKYNNTDEGVKDPKPNSKGEKIIEKFVNDKLEEHRENQTILNNLQEELHTEQDNLKSLQGELTELKIQQGKYESHVPNNTKAETGILASIGLGVAAAGAGTAGLFAVNSSKVVPKVKLRRANTQAVHSLNQVVTTNQPPVSETNTIDAMKPESSIIRRNSL